MIATAINMLGFHMSKTLNERLPYLFLSKKIQFFPIKL